MQLAKPHVDVGLMTNAREPMLAFWQRDVGLPFEELLKVGGGVQQLRHGLNGSVLKLNHVRDPLPGRPPAGYRELVIARPGLTRASELCDPDGNRVRLVPPGTDGVAGIGVHLRVRDAAAFDRFYGEVLQLERCADGGYRCGDSRLWFRADPEATAEADMQGRGYRYLTVQVRDVDAEHAGVLARGGAEGQPPRTLGATARISFIRDPDGNWIELSQRASLTGPLPE